MSHITKKVTAWQLLLLVEEGSSSGFNLKTNLSEFGSLGNINIQTLFLNCQACKSPFGSDVLPGSYQLLPKKVEFFSGDFHKEGERRKVSLS